MKGEGGWSQLMEEKSERRSLRPVAFAAVVFSTVSLASCLVMFPMILHHIQTLESAIQMDLDFCQVRLKNLTRQPGYWKNTSFTVVHYLFERLFMHANSCDHLKLIGFNLKKPYLVVSTTKKMNKKVKSKCLVHIFRRAIAGKSSRSVERNAGYPHWRTKRLR